MKIGRASIPVGDKYIEEKFFKDHKFDKKLLKEVEKLLFYHAFWHYRVFFNLNEEVKERKIKETLAKLDREEKFY